jgi:hypothetical protein
MKTRPAQLEAPRPTPPNRMDNATWEADRLLQRLSASGPTRSSSVKMHFSLAAGFNLPTWRRAQALHFL